MAQNFGMETPQRARPAPVPDAQPAVRYVVLIDAASHGTRLARLFLASREQVAEFDAAGPEVQALTSSLLADEGTAGPEWDAALAGHSPAERRVAQVFTLDV